MTIKINGTNTTAQPSITGTDTDTGLVYGDDDVKIVTGGTEKVKVDSSGNVGIGATSTGANLHISSPSTTAYMTIQDSDGYGEIAESAGNLYITADRGSVGSKDMIFRVGGTTERARFLSTGGLTFNGDTATANALDDYEEGTWTPQAFNNENGASTVSTSTRAAKYIRVGNVVHICCYIKCLKGTNSGNYVIENLPFATGANGHLHAGISVGYFHGLSVAKSMLCATVQPNSSTILLRCISGTQGGATATLSASEVSSSLDLIVGGTYIAA